MSSFVIGMRDIYGVNAVDTAGIYTYVHTYLPSLILAERFDDVAWGQSTEKRIGFFIALPAKR